MAYNPMEARAIAAAKREALKVVGVNWNRKRKRWIAGTDALGYFGSYIKREDANEAMGLRKQTAKAQETDGKRKGVRNDADYCPTKQRYLSQGW